MNTHAPVCFCLRWLRAGGLFPGTEEAESCEDIDAEEAYQSGIGTIAPWNGFGWGRHMSAAPTKAEADRSMGVPSIECAPHLETHGSS